MRGGAQLQEHGLGDARRVGGRDLDRRVVGGAGGSRGDGGPRALVQVRRRVVLERPLGHVLRVGLAVVAHRDDPPVGQQQGRGVIRALVGLGIGLGPGPGGRVVELGREDRALVEAAVVAADAAAHREKLPVREHDGVDVASATDVRRAGRDRPGGRVHQQGARRGRGIVVVDVRVRPAGHHDRGRPPRTRGQRHRGAPLAADREVGRVLPGPGGGIQDRRVGSLRAERQDLPGGRQEQVRVEPEEALGGGLALDGADPVHVGRGREHLDVGVVELAVDAARVEPGHDHHAPVGQLDEGRVPAPVAHAPLVGPGLVERVERDHHVQAAVLRAGVGVVGQVPAGDHQAAVTEEGLAAAPEVEGLAGARVGGRVAPDAGVGGRVEDVGVDVVEGLVRGRRVGRGPVRLAAIGEPQDLPRGEQCGVDRQAIDLDLPRPPARDVGRLLRERALDRPAGLRAEARVLPPVRDAAAAVALEALGAGPLRGDLGAAGAIARPVGLVGAARVADAVPAEVAVDPRVVGRVLVADSRLEAAVEGGRTGAAREHRRQPQDPRRHDGRDDDRQEAPAPTADPGDAFQLVTRRPASSCRW